MMIYLNVARLFALVLIASPLLTSCSNSPLNVDYYTLTYPITEKAGSVAHPAKRKLVLIESVSLSEYLRQQGLVTQSNSNQLKFSEQHRWAEKLDEAIMRSMLSHLEMQRPDLRFEGFRGRWKLEPAQRINLEITHFQVLAKGETKVAGRYWVFDGDNRLMEKSTFSILKPLTEDGFKNAVAQFDQSLTELASRISRDLIPIKS